MSKVEELDEFKILKQQMKDELMADMRKDIIDNLNTHIYTMIDSEGNRELNIQVLFDGYMISNESVNI